MGRGPVGMHPRPTTAALAVAFLVVVALPSAAQTDHRPPEWTDPAGDVVVTEGGILTGTLSDDDFADVDLTTAWIEAVPTHDYPAIRITIESVGALRDDTRTTLEVAARTTERSYGPPSELQDEPSVTVVFLGADRDSGPDSFGAIADGTRLVIDLDTHALGGVPGDDIVLVRIERERSRTASVPVLDDDQTATDAFEGTATPFAIPRDPMRAAATLTVTGGELRDRTGTYPFSTLPVATEDRDAQLDVHVQVRNTGTDWDTIAVAGDAGKGAIVSIQSGSLDLAPNEEADLLVTVRLRGAIDHVPLWLNASSTRGATAALANEVTVLGKAGTTPAVVSPGDLPPEPTPAPPAGRTPMPGGLAWLTPAAEAMRLDDLLGEYAELALLALLVLIAVVLVVLAWVLVRVRRDEAVVPDDEPVEAGEAILEAASMRDVRAQVIPGKPTLVLDDLEHLPSDPRPGDAMTSTITVENTGEVGARLRATLEVDGELLGSRVVAAPSHHRVRVKFPWVAGLGDNQAVIRIYPA